MNAAWPWIRARIIAVLLWSVFVIGFSILPLLAVYFFVRFQGEKPGLDLLFGDGQGLSHYQCDFRRRPRKDHLGTVVKTNAAGDFSADTAAGMYRAGNHFYLAVYVSFVLETPKPSG